MNDELFLLNFSVEYFILMFLIKQHSGVNDKDSGSDGGGGDSDGNSGHERCGDKANSVNFFLMLSFDRPKRFVRFSSGRCNCKIVFFTSHELWHESKDTMIRIAGRCFLHVDM